jgi:uncharacterized DUF497 family protein
VIFSWNVENIEHIGRHGVKSAEAEHVVRHAGPPWPERFGRDRYLVWGQTADGRYLQVVYIIPDDDKVDIDSLSFAELAAWSDDEDEIAYIIHARDLEEDEKRNYRKRRRKST